MVVGQGSAADGIEPVGVIATVGIVGLAGTDILTFHHVETLAKRGQRNITAIVGSGAALALASLGRDQDHTCGTTRTIDSGSRSILQYVDTLYILRSHTGEAAFQTVNQYERCVSTLEGDDTTQADAGSGTRVTRAIADGQTSHLTFNQVTSIVDITLSEVLSLYAGDSRGDITLALRTITDDDDLVQEGIVFLEGHVATGLHLLGYEADVTHDKRCVAVGNIQRVVTVVVGDGCVLGALLSHRGADNRLALGVCDNTLHRDALLSDLSDVARYAFCSQCGHAA